MATIVLGTAFGDEGKGKLVDILSRDVQLCARAQLDLLPSGLVNPNCMNLIGSGTIVHVPTFFQELQNLVKKGLKHAPERILISDRCHIITDLHVRVDGLEEQELGGRNIGTTKRGVGPTYTSMAARNGITISEMFNEETFERKLRALAAGYKKRYGDLLDYDVEEELGRFKEYRPEIANYVIDAVPLIADAQKKGTKILVEGAQALMLDITSSNTGLGGIFTGLALNPRQIDHVIGVVKAYSTRVGSGRLPTELLDETGEKLQKIGHEVGVSTGRPRRCGWLDLVILKYSQSINHYTALNLTKLDILDTFPTIKLTDLLLQIAIAYRDPRTGDILESFPADVDLLDRVEVVYHELEGWNKPTTSAKAYYDLPKQARAYIEYIEEFVGVKIAWIGTGPSRDDMIFRGSKALTKA
ncbi:Adenylosuccinate synthase [Diatrype stigma]|uniref:Adenylosuccinate synthetase n=1 Tax=Diatrype stigma TaxID=117547 RepID=A0AAN9UMB4_9PEZI